MRECRTPCGVQYADWVLEAAILQFQSNAPHAGCNSLRRALVIWSLPFQSNAPCAGCNEIVYYGIMRIKRFQSNAPRAGCNIQCRLAILLFGKFQSNAPRAGCNSKTIQFKCILVARRMYSFANHALHTTKHSLTYCIGTTL